MYREQNAEHLTIKVADFMSKFISPLLSLCFTSINALENQFSFKLYCGIICHVKFKLLFLL